LVQKGGGKKKVLGNNQRWVEKKEMGIKKEGRKLGTFGVSNSGQTKGLGASLKTIGDG